MTEPQRSAVRAVIVTFNPDLARLAQVVESLRPQVQGVVIVDNGSANVDAISSLCDERTDVDFLGLDDNRGIGAALNIGVQRSLVADPEWILTMDQDTVVFKEGVESILASFESLTPPNRDRVGILAMRAQPQPSSIWITRYADQLLVIDRLEAFEERRGVITSGNLLRADVARRASFDERLFIDQVDFEFCFAVRRLGYHVLVHDQIAMDHVLGGRYHDTEKEHPYENAQRVYYIARNSTFLVLRRRLRVRFYFVQIVVFCGAFVSMNGARSLPLCVRILLRAVVDAVTGRLGRREYPFLSKGRK
ncbi:MAG: glycosyltransferase [Acidobacteria bacterium]|nr:glycosyltransferase [Acidobacteriota bacterium]